MKKVAFGALALATVIGLSVMSPLTTAAAEAEIAREAEILRAIDEKNQYIGDLLTEQSHAYLRGDIKTAENIGFHLVLKKNLKISRRFDQIAVEILSGLG